MACETLEQRVYDNGFSQCRAVGTIDAYTMGAYAQYAGPRCEMGGLHDCGIDGWNSTDHGPRPVGSASAADFDPYGHKEIYPAESRWAVTAAFSEGGILDSSRETWHGNNLLHPNENDDLLKSIYKPHRDFTLDIYNRGEVSVHQFGEYNPASKRISNIHIDLGLDHGTKLDVDRLTGDNNQIKDLWPLFER